MSVKTLSCLLVEVEAKIAGFASSVLAVPVSTERADQLADSIAIEEISEGTFGTDST